HGVAAAARQQGLGVWGLDATSLFQLDDQTSIGPAGQLILPKLFRRCTDYLKSVDKGFQGNLQDWLIDSSSLVSRDENDRVLLNGRVQVLLSQLLDQRNNDIAFQADVLEI